MNQDVYRRLAEKLESTPNGFLRTASGVELRILAWMFTPEEAGVASIMDLAPEPAARIAQRAGLEPEDAARMLSRMVEKGLVLRARGADSALFALRPFIVGSYEAQLSRMDEEFATLVEQYFVETKGGIARDLPHLHRVLPVEKAIPFELDIFPYERAAELLEGAKSWGVRPCVCRVQQRLVGKGCARAVENCIMFAPVEGAFDDGEDGRAITKQEALDILREAAESGLIHSTANYRSGNTYICNCCTCCCGVLRSVSLLGMNRTMARSGFRAQVNEDLCTGCGACVARCQFGALSVPDEICRVDASRCAGCGQCTMGCAAGAVALLRLSESETLEPPADLRDWRSKRLESRGPGKP